MAMNFYAKPRMTRDIDLVMEIYFNLDHFIPLFDDFSFRARNDLQALLQKTLFNLIPMDSHQNRLCHSKRYAHAEEFSRRQTVNIEGNPLHIVSPEDLILSKLEWAKDTRSETQLADIRNLLTMAPGQSLFGWASTLGVTYSRNYFHEPLIRTLKKSTTTC